MTPHVGSAGTLTVCSFPVPRQADLSRCQRIGRWPAVQYCQDPSSLHWRILLDSWCVSAAGQGNLGEVNSPAVATSERVLPIRRSVGTDFCLLLSPPGVSSAFSLVVVLVCLVLWATKEAPRKALHIRSKVIVRLSFRAYLG